ncbi:MAG: hypothetical protein ACREJ9_13885 [Candidatus Rokuibacteriota bacterium]
MPTRASYEFKIEGLLEGPPGKNGSEIGQFRNLMPEPTRDIGRLDSPEAWPDGVRLRGYNVCRWEADGYAYGEARDKTLLSLYAEITFFIDAGISEQHVQDKLLPDVAWFYKLKGQAWFKDLVMRLEGDPTKGTPGFNDQLGGKLIERVRMRDWRWYCGNAGGG